MRILFSTFGSLGDLHPYLAVALEAKNRGHEPILATAAKYRAKIEALGLEFRAVRPDLPAEADFGPLARRVMDLKDGPRFLFQEILSPALRDSYADLLAASQDVDLIITHPAALAGPLVAQKLGKKWLSSVLAPISLWSKSDPPVPPTLPHLDFLRKVGPMWPRLFIAMGRAGTKSWVAPVEKLRREIGLPKSGHPMFEGQFSPFGTLALFSRHFAAPQRDWPKNTVATGFCFYDAQGYSENNAQNNAQNNTQNWREWIAKGEKPIVFTLGSSAVHDAGDFWEASRISIRNGYQPEALDPDYRGLYLTGADAIDLERSPWDFEERVDTDFWEFQQDYAPYSELFPASQLVVHQGGAGTTAQALRAGAPQIVIPHAHDQPDNAARISRLGVGVGIPLKNYIVNRVSFEQILGQNQPYAARAQQLGEKVRAENGPLAACEAIERLAT